MKISVNYLKKYLDFELPPIEVLLDRIGSQLGAIDEGVVDLWEIYNQVIVAKVVECQKMEGSDHLSLCKIDDGHRYHDDSVRLSDGLIQVVCGAPNVSSGLLVAWLPPKTVVPATFHKDKLVLESREIQGQTSQGMLASSKELMIDDDHDGILVIDREAKPGDSFAKLYELDDYVIDIENKMFTHRPDCFGLLGVARELSGILNKPFKSPDWYLDQPTFEPASKDLPFKVGNEIPSLVPRFSAISIDKLKLDKSPIQTRSYLSRMGVRPINSIVDATNLCMLETGQPLHAYDYQALKSLSGGDITLTARNPKADEKVSLIKDKTVTPPSESIVIACNEPVGMGGIMGATNSAISEKTTSIILESANFDMYSIRRTSMALGLFSDAVTRFTKGQSPLQTTRVLSRALQLIKELCGNEAVIASDLVDNNHLPEETMKRDSLNPDISVPVSYINDRLGTSLQPENMAELLDNVECSTKADSNEIEIHAPFWRTDIEIREDVIEEVGRLYGYDNIKQTELSRSIDPTKVNSDLNTKLRIREALASAGANEALTYSFISKRLLNDCNQDETKAYELSNALSPEIQYYRLSIIPSLLNKVNSNIKAGYPLFSLFEIGSPQQIGQQFPSFRSTLALVYASNSDSTEPSYYQARAFIDYTLKKLGKPGVTYEPLKEENLPAELQERAKPFNAARSAVIIGKNKQPCGIVGEFKYSTRSKLKLPKNCAGFEVDINLFEPEQSSSQYHKLSKYPFVKQDMTLKLPSAKSYAELIEFLSSELKHKIGDDGYFEIELYSTYQSKDDPDHINYSFKVSVADYGRTLKDEEVNQLLDQVANQAADKLQASRV